jgi:pimeloyl-ACP methyl ester carboxylesterase
MEETIAFSKFGSGPPVILLHGFPMHSGVWEKFARELARDYTVYTPDLPGFGKSPLPAGGFSIEGIASRMNDWIKENRIYSPAVIGHSMGGYVALNMVLQSPLSFSALGLFHSTATEDSAEKKESRTKVMQFVDDNGVLAFTSNFIPPLFADQNHPGIPFVKEITVQATADAVKGYTRAMRDREDTREVLKAFGGPILIIGGEVDKGIPSESLREQGELNPMISVHILPDTGHMGMVERPDETLQLVREFLRKIDQP